MGSNIMDELREIADGNGKETQKALLRILAASQADLHNGINELQAGMMDIKTSVNGNKDDIESIKDCAEATALAAENIDRRVKKIEENPAVKTGAYLGNHLVTTVLLGILVFFIALHSMGFEVDIYGILQEIAKFIGIF